MSSGAVVYALDCQRGDNVLDVCCAPGNLFYHCASNKLIIILNTGSKFCLLADVMDHTGTVTGFYFLLFLFFRFHFSLGLLIIS